MKIKRHGNFCLGGMSSLELEGVIVKTLCNIWRILSVPRTLGGCDVTLSAIEMQIGVLFNFIPKI